MEEDGEIMAGARTYRKKHLVFDLDGTLIDSAPDIASAVNALFSEIGVAPVGLEEVRRMIGDGAPVLLERALKLTGASQDASRLMARYAEHYAANTRGLTTLYPGVVETLNELASSGCRLGLCTNKPYLPTLDVLKGFGLDHLFGAIVAGDTMVERKPDPAPLLEVVRQLAGTPASAVMIGDSAVDLRTAEAASMDAIIIPSGYGMEPVRHSIMAESFKELPAILEWL